MERVTDEAIHKVLGDSLVRVTTTASSLEAEQDNGNINRTQSKVIPNELSSQRTSSDGGPRCQEAMRDAIAQTRVKKLERRNKSRTHKLKRLYKVRLTARVESSDNEESLGEDASKKEMRIDDIDANEDITLDKGKGILEEEPVKPKKKDQIRLDEEVALKLQAKFDEEQRLNRVGARTRKRKESRRRVDTKESKEAKETSKIKQLMEIILDKVEVAIDGIPLVVKSLKIVDWKIYKEGKKSNYQILKADGKSLMYMFFSQMLTSFDREDLEDLYKLVKAKYGSTRPMQDLDLLLWGDLKTMFEPHVEDAIWKKQQGYKVLE
nr:hypothetical protein [Tanacetum cinerariifolium]